MTRSEAKAYLERWEPLEEAELAELRRASMDTKLGRLAALMASRSLFGSDPERESELQVVRDRWSLLWKVMGD